MKYFVLIPDGMADEPIEALGNVTPMEKANKPCMDALAKKAVVGTVSNVPAGMVPESDTANLAILSYDPKEFSKGRSPLEAVSIGKVNHADTNATGLVGVGRADTLLRGTNFLVAESFFLGGIDFLVDRQHHMGSVGNEQLFGGDAHALIKKIVDFLHKRCGVNHYAITDDVHFVVPEDA